MKRAMEKISVKRKKVNENVERVTCREAGVTATNELCLHQMLLVGIYPPVPH